MKYLKDFIWMQRAGEPPERVAIDHSKPKELNALLSAKMTAGYLQIDPEADQPEVVTEPAKEPQSSVHS